MSVILPWQHIVCCTVDPPSKSRGNVVKGLFALMSSGRRFYEFQRYDFTIVRLTILRLADMIRANFQFKRRTSWNLKGISSKRRKKPLRHFAQWPFEHKGAKMRTWCMSGNCAKRFLPIIAIIKCQLAYGAAKPQRSAKCVRTAMFLCEMPSPSMDAAF